MFLHIMSEMNRESIWMIAGLLGVLALGAAYGYWIGNIGKRRSWTYKTIKGVAGLPILGTGLILLVASVISRESSGNVGSAQAWARFPWAVTVTAGFLSMLVTARV